MCRNSIFFTLAAIIALGICLRLYGLDKQSLWYDEIYEEKAFQYQFLGDTSGSVPDTPPLHLFFVYPVTKLFPLNDFALRIVPFSFGVLSILLMFFLGRDLFNDKVGLTSSFIIAISPFYIWYSQDARMYALQWMLAIASLLFFVRLLNNYNTNDVVLYVISSVAGLYTNQLSVFLLMAQVVHILLYKMKQKKQLINWAIAFTSIVVLYTPWIIYNLIELMDRGTSFPRDVNPVMNILYTFYAFSTGFSLGPSLRELHFNPSVSELSPYILQVCAVALVYGSSFIAGIFATRKDYSRLVLLILVTALPILGLIILIETLMVKMTYNVRYAGIASIGFILIIAKGMEWLFTYKTSLTGKTLAFVLFASLVGLSAYSYANYQFNVKYQKENIRSAVSYVKQNLQIGDSALCIEDPEVFNRYSSTEIQCIKFPFIEISSSAVEEEMPSIVTGNKRLWLVLSREWYRKDLWNHVKSWLDKSFEEIKDLRRDSTDIANVRIFCYDLSEKASVKSD